MDTYNLCKLLFFLSKDARIKTKELGRLLNVSQQNISYTINKLVSEKTIKSYQAIIDPAKFSLINIIIFLNYQNFDQKTTSAIKKYLKEDTSIVRIEETVQGADLLVEYCVPNLSYFNKQYKEFMFTFHDLVYLVETFVVIVKHNYTKNYLHKRYPDISQIIISGDRDPIILDDRQNKILQEITNDPIIPIVKISNKNKFDPKTVKNNKKFLEKKEIIRKYSIVIDHAALEITREFIFLNLAPEKLEDEKRFLEFCTLHKNIIVVTKVLGKYDLLITTERLPKDSVVISDLRKEFRVKDYKIIASDNIIKYNFLPEEY